MNVKVVDLQGEKITVPLWGGLSAVAVATSFYEVARLRASRFGGQPTLQPSPSGYGRQDAKAGTGKVPS